MTALHPDPQIVITRDTRTIELQYNAYHFHPEADDCDIEEYLIDNLMAANNSLPNRRGWEVTEHYTLTDGTIRLELTPYGLHRLPAKYRK